MWPPAAATSSARAACARWSQTWLALVVSSISGSQYLGCGTMSPRRIFVHRARDNPVAACICRSVVPARPGRTSRMNRTGSGRPCSRSHSRLAARRARIRRAIGDAGWADASPSASPNSRVTPVGPRGRRRDLTPNSLEAVPNHRRFRLAPPRRSATSPAIGRTSRAHSDAVAARSCVSGGIGTGRRATRRHPLS